MAAIDVNEEELREALIKLYESFLKNPGDNDIKNRAIDYDNKYGGLCNRKYVPDILEEGIVGLSSIYQYNMHDESHPAFSNSKIIEEAKEILQKLKQFKNKINGK